MTHCVSARTEVIDLVLSLKASLSFLGWLRLPMPSTPDHLSSVVTNQLSVVVADQVFF